MLRLSSRPASVRPARLASALETAAAGVLIVFAGMLSGAVLSGCDSEDIGPGDFEGTVQIDGVAQDVEGEAVYTVVETDEGPRFVVGLFVGDLYDSDYDGYNFASLRRTGSRPGVGAYSVTTEGASRAFTGSYARVQDANRPSDAVGPVIRATEGVVTFTQIDGYGFVSGTFSFSGDGIRVENPRERVRGEVTGTFEARYESPGTLRQLGVDIGLDG